MNESHKHVIRQKLEANLPEWLSASIEPVQSGQSRDCYRLTGKHARALFKFDRSVRDAFANPRLEEARIQREAASRGFAPDVLFVDHECIMTEYLTATPLAVDAIREHDVLKELGTLLREVHSLPLSTLDSDLVSAARRYAASIDDPAMTARCLDAIAGVPATAEALCHNDVVAGNILRSASLFLIDWEYARNHSPLFDLATVIAHHALTADEARILLNAYDASGVSARDLSRYQTAYHALHWLWLASREPQHPDLAAIAAQIEV